MKRATCLCLIYWLIRLCFIFKFVFWIARTYCTLQISLQVSIPGQEIGKHVGKMKGDESYVVTWKLESHTLST
jgi:hypothetical protein